MNEYRIFIPRREGEGYMSFWTSRRAAGPEDALQAVLQDSPSQFQNGDHVVVIDMGRTGSRTPANGNVFQYRIEKPAAMRAVPV